MASAAIPVRGKGQTTCAHHKGRQLEMFCEKCKDLICMKCLSSVHKSHTVCELSEITSQKKQDIKNFIDRTEQNDLVEIGKYIASSDTLLKDNDSSFEKLSHQISMQTEKLKHDLDKLTTETLSLYKKMKEDNANLIQKYKNDLDMYNKQLKQQIQRCKTALQQGSDIEIHDTKCVIDSQLHLPAKPVLGTITFTPNKNPQNHLEQALGKVVTSGQGQTSIEKDPSSDGHLQQQTWNKAVSRTTLLTETRVVEEWRSPCFIISICHTIDDKAWTMSSNTLTLLDRKGKVIQIVTHKADINEISLSPTTQRLWTCDSENNILELVSGRLTQRFRTNKEPICICVTSSDHVLVGMSRHVSKYTTQGQVVRSTKATGTRKPLVCSPWKITECPVTNNVAVIDHSCKPDGGDGNSRVVVVDTDFRELFVYRGDIHSTYQQTPQTGDEPFNPRDIVYDSQGNIIIGDYINQRLLILSGRGEVLRILHTDTDSVLTVGIDRHDIVWSVFGDPFPCKVKLLQYSSNT